MNNEQFRRLAFENTAKTGKSPGQDASPANPAATPGSRSQVLGSRNRSSIPMTPRSITGVNFARQLAEHRRESEQPPSKKLKSKSAPKGSKIAAGYQDRTLLRRQLDERAGEGGNNSQDSDDREQRLQALEEMVKLGQMDQDTFENLKKEIGVGGDLGSTHLVKGLDLELLRRVREGEDVSTAPQRKADDGSGGGDGPDVDAEFDRVLEEKEKDVQPVKKDEKAKRGTMAPPPPPPGGAVAGRKMTRDEILKQLKASRTGATSVTLAKEEVPTSTLGAKFKKIGDTGNKKRWVEADKDGRRREVLLTTDSEGKTKRKIRWLDKPVDAQQGKANGDLLPVNKDAKPLGMEVPADILSRTKAVEEEGQDEDEDIFQGVGADYKADLEDGSSTSGSEAEDGTEPDGTRLTREEANEPGAESEETLHPSTRPSQPRNYFSTDITEQTSETTDKANPLVSDPTILAAFKRAAAIRSGASSSNVTGDDEANEDDELRRKKFLEEARKREMQDSMDIEMGFGESRFGDEEDEEIWQEHGTTGNKRKRGPKKKKGDKESAGDVMKVLEGRQKAKDKS